MSARVPGAGGPEARERKVRLSRGSIRAPIARSGAGSTSRAMRRVRSSRPADTTMWGHGQRGARPVSGLVEGSDVPRGALPGKPGRERLDGEDAPHYAVPWGGTGGGSSGEHGGREEACGGGRAPGRRHGGSPPSL